MALDFPDTPTLGQVFSPAGVGRSWEWDATAWVLQSATGGGIDTEAAVDAVAAALVEGTGIDIVYDDTANTITLSSTASGGGTTLLSGVGVPTALTGAVGDFYIDQTGDDIYGPKSASGYGADQSIEISGSPDGNALGSWEHGVRVQFTRAGQINQLRYQRNSGSSDTLTLRAWRAAGTLITSVTDTRAGQTGEFVVTFPSTVTVAAGEILHFSMGAATVPRRTSAGTQTNSTDCTFLDFRRGSLDGQFPNTLDTNTFFVEPIYQPDVGPWPLALETTSGGGGTTILNGTVQPDTATGAVGDYYEDTATGVLYGPKNATGWGAEQIPTYNGTTPNTQAGYEVGFQWRFARAGRITKVRYYRRSTATLTTTFNIWNPTTQALVYTWTDTQAAVSGTFDTVLPVPFPVSGGSEWVVSMGAAAMSLTGSAMTGLNSTADVSGVPPYPRSTTTAGTYPSSGPISHGDLVPIFEANDSWPATVRRVPVADSVSDPELAAIGNLVSAADTIPYYTGVGTAALTTITSTARNLLDDTSASAMRTSLGVVIGTDVAPARRVITTSTGTTFAPVVGSENTMVTLSNAAAITVTLPSMATSAFPLGAEVDFLWLGVGQPTFVAGSSATLNGTPGLKLRAQYSACTAKKIATNDWVLIGDLSA